MQLYPWLVVIHVAAILAFFFAHGAAASVALRLRQERDLARVRTLLELSRSSVGAAMAASFLITLASGVWLGFLGGWWNRGWIWVSLGILILVAVLMTPMAAIPLNRLRQAACIARGKAGEIPPANEAELARLLEAWNPVPVAALGIGALVVITWLMYFKPF